MAEKVTAGLAESNANLPAGLSHLHADWLETRPAPAITIVSNMRKRFAVDRLTS